MTMKKPRKCRPHQGAFLSLCWKMDRDQSRGDDIRRFSVHWRAVIANKQPNARGGLDRVVTQPPRHWMHRGNMQTHNFAKRKVCFSPSILTSWVMPHSDGRPVANRAQLSGRAVAFWSRAWRIHRHHVGSWPKKSFSHRHRILRRWSHKRRRVLRNVCTCLLCPPTRL